MHRDLHSIIRRFRVDQDAGVRVLIERLGIQPPSSNIAWARALQQEGPLSAIAIFERAREMGMFVRPHGFGIELILDGVTIDFDWGDRGEAYGFDLYRLWNHCYCNKLYFDVITEKLLTIYFQHALARGLFQRDENLFYLPDERTERLIGVDLSIPSEYRQARSRAEQMLPLDASK